MEELKDGLDKYIITEDTSIIDAMRRLDETARGILFAVDRQGRLSGCLTDGDIRRWILKTGKLAGKAGLMINRSPAFLFEGDREGDKGMLKGHRVVSMPVINSDRKIVGIRFGNGKQQDDLQKGQDALREANVIIMAGGKGTRLYPYTKILPKPLIPIGDIPILERILCRFHSYGVRRFYITVNYKKEMIKSYFTELNLPFEIHYVEESQPLGTAGSIRLIEDKFQSPVIITNCDILIEADYTNMLDYHIKSGNCMTVVSSLKHTSIPYGVLHTEQNGIISSIEEKPQLSYLVNTGMYIVNPACLPYIPENTVFHMTDLLEAMMGQGGQVGMYPISENAFLDMGEFEEMKRMEERMNANRENPAEAAYEGM